MFDQDMSLTWTCGQFDVLTIDNCVDVCERKPKTHVIYDDDDDYGDNMAIMHSDDDVDDDACVHDVCLCVYVCVRHELWCVAAALFDVVCCVCLLLRCVHTYV